MRVLNSLAILGLAASLAHCRTPQQDSSVANFEPRESDNPELTGLDGIKSVTAEVLDTSPGLDETGEEVDNVNRRTTYKINFVNSESARLYITGKDANGDGIIIDQDIKMTITRARCPSCYILAGRSNRNYSNRDVKVVLENVAVVALPNETSGTVTFRGFESSFTKIEILGMNNVSRTVTR